MAEPTPALVSGTADMISVVSGVIVSAMPVARNRIGPYMNQMLESTPRSENSTSPSGHAAQARRDEAFTPKRATSFGTCGDRPIITKAIGSWNRPDSKAE